MKLKIYIAGPMKNRPAFNYPVFNQKAEQLRTDGWEVVNPVEIGAKYGKPDEIAADPDLMRQVVAAELAELERCQAIYLLPGWELSEGARNELAAALKHGLQIFFDFAYVRQADAALADYIRVTSDDFAAKIRCAEDECERYAYVVNKSQKMLDEARAKKKRLHDAFAAAAAFAGMSDMAK